MKLCMCVKCFRMCWYLILVLMLFVLNWWIFYWIVVMCMLCRVNLYCFFLRCCRMSVMFCWKYGWRLLNGLIYCLMLVFCVWLWMWSLVICRCGLIWCSSILLVRIMRWFWSNCFLLLSGIVYFVMMLFVRWWFWYLIWCVMCCRWFCIGVGSLCLNWIEELLCDWFM